MVRSILAALACALALTSEAHTNPLVLRASSTERLAIPFRAGEKFTYDAAFGPIHIGRGTIELTGFDTVRTHLAWRATMTVAGGLPFYKVRDSTISWFDIRTLSSFRYAQHLREGSYSADRVYEIYPERATYARNGRPEAPSVAEPLDDTSFLYFLRTIPLDVGQRYEFFRYFQPDGNPVVIKVVRKERVKVPAGTFNTIVLQPRIAAEGIFSKKERAEVWISDDSVRMIVQIKSHVKFGSLRLSLKSYSRGIQDPATAAASTSVDRIGRLVELSRNSPRE